LREEVLPKNILMIGPTGVGKTRSRGGWRSSPTRLPQGRGHQVYEVGYVGRDVEQIIRDLVEVAIVQVRERKRKDVKPARSRRRRARVDALVGPASSPATRDSFRKKLRAGDSTTRKSRSRRNPPAACRCSKSGHARRADGRDFDRRYLRKMGGEPNPPPDGRRLTRDSRQRGVRTNCWTATNWCWKPSIAVENNGIVFLDEIDKICVRDGRTGGDVSREGVQRDLLP
jgi:ATP-dependent HslUV protease ATP-binding subunit HslU